VFAVNQSHARVSNAQLESLEYFLLQWILSIPFIVIIPLGEQSNPQGVSEVLFQLSSFAARIWNLKFREQRDIHCACKVYFQLIVGISAGPTLRLLKQTLAQYQHQLCFRTNTIPYAPQFRALEAQCRKVGSSHYAESLSSEMITGGQSGERNNLVVPLRWSHSYANVTSWEM